MVNFEHEPTEKQIDSWYRKMSPGQKAQLDKEVKEFHKSLETEEAMREEKKKRAFTVVHKLTNPPLSGE
ncbi:MAG TPA: hypothetical protein VEA37_02705 [Flavobacterium sp.]|nr:hypothetical protein [Flavobacterium sp.]